MKIRAQNNSEVIEPDKSLLINFSISHIQLELRKRLIIIYFKWKQAIFYNMYILS